MKLVLPWIICLRYLMSLVLMSSLERVLVTSAFGLWDAAEIEHEIKLNKTRVQCYKEFKEFRRRHVSLPTCQVWYFARKKSDSILHFICLLMQVYSKIELEVGCSCVVASFYSWVASLYLLKAVCLNLTEVWSLFVFAFMCMSYINL